MPSDRSSRMTWLVPANSVLRGGWRHGFSTRELRLVGAIAALAIIIAWALSAGPADTYDVDHLAHRQTAETMELGFHHAMDQAMIERDGGPSGSVRSFRLPTLFWIWSVTGTDWATFLAFLACFAIVLVWLLPRPLGVPVIILYLTVNSFPLLDRGWQAQWLAVELWAVPVAMIGIALWWRRRDIPAAAVATSAAFLREHLALLLIGGLLQAWREGRRSWPWLTGLASFGLFYAWHAASTLPRLADVGAEAALWGGGIDGFIAISSFGIPGGFLLWGLAFWRCRRDWLPIPLLLLALAGFLVDRPYWGLMVVPMALLVIVQPERPVVTQA